MRSHPLVAVLSSLTLLALIVAYRDLSTGLQNSHELLPCCDCAFSSDCFALSPSIAIATSPSIHSLLTKISRGLSTSIKVTRSSDTSLSSRRAAVELHALGWTLDRHYIALRWPAKFTPHCALALVLVLRPTGTSILLIPFSFNFVDGVCIATVLGFLCGSLDKVVLLLGSRASGNKVAVLAGEGKELVAADCEVGETLPDGDEKKKNGIRTSPGLPTRRYTTANIYSAPATPLRVHGTARSDANESGKSPLRHICISPLNRRIHGIYGRRFSFTDGSTAVSLTRRPSGNIFQHSLRPVGNTVSVHWVLALIATLQLVVSTINERFPDG